MGQKHICLVIMVLLAASLASSCVKKKNPPAQASSAMNATLSGLSWSANTFKITNTGGFDTISGSRTSDSSRIMLLFPPVQNSQDTLLVGSVNTIEYVKSNITYIGISGAIAISSNANNVITGTFYGTVEDFSTSNKVTITGGSFTARF